MHLKRDSWVTAEPLEGREREIIFILLEAARFDIYAPLRNYDPRIDAKCIGWAGDGKGYIVRCKVFGLQPEEIDQVRPWIEGGIFMHKFTVEQLKNHLIEYIKYH